MCMNVYIGLMFLAKLITFIYILKFFFIVNCCYVTLPGETYTSIHLDRAQTTDQRNNSIQVYLSEPVGLLDWGATKLWMKGYFQQDRELKDSCHWEAHPRWVTLYKNCVPELHVPLADSTVGWGFSSPTAVVTAYRIICKSLLNLLSYRNFLRLVNC